jgi:hypothetical protein
MTAPHTTGALGTGALAAGLVAAVAAGETLAATVLGLVGVAVLALGLLEGAHRAIAAGSGLLYAEVLVAGYDGLGVVSIVVAGGATTVAYALAGAAVDLRTDVARVHGRLALLRAGATLGLVGLAGGLALAAWRVVPGEPSVTVGVLLVVGGAAALAALGASVDSR